MVRLFCLGIWAVFHLALQCHGLLEEEIVTFDLGNAAATALSIVDCPIMLAKDDFIGVHIATQSLAAGLEQITGKARKTLNFTASNATIASPLASAIIVGTFNSSLVQNLVTNKLIDVSDIQGKWETFKTAVVNNPLPGVSRALVIVGSDKRGTIFGIYTLAEQSGQSPYHWFADVPTQKHSQLYALTKTTVHGEPSVKYRGLFINDEAPALTSWWSRYNNASHAPLNREFYAHVFDLLLRLKANYLWPAMWKLSTPPPGNIFFTDDPGNQQLADDYGIVISTSHHEPMQRATNEWDETVTGPWDWSKNKDNITMFMDEGIRRAGHNESYFTVGMRGLGDRGLNPTDAIPTLREVFAAQRDIIKKYHGSETAVNQVWALYKEVASYYDAGLNPPEDITLLFPDDNSGNVYRLPTGDEISRKGGTGVYYHLEYVGLPRSYKGFNSNNLAKVMKELIQSYLRGARQIWIVNVGDIKPMELPFSLAMDMAWNVSNFSFDKIPSYLKKWATREFGAECAEGTATILLEHSLLIGMRRHELVSPGTFSTLNYHEAERIAARWQVLADRIKSLYARIPAESRPAFFQLVYHPVRSGFLYYSATIGVGINYKFALERRNSANSIAQQVLKDFDSSYDMVEEYDGMLGGKWANMMSQAVFDDVQQEPKSWAGPSRDMLANLSYVQLRQNMQYSVGNLGIYAEESTSPVGQGRWVESVDTSMPTTGAASALLPPMDFYGPRTRHVDLFMRGDYRVPIQWSLEKIPVDWLSVSPANGTLSRDQMDQRLNVTIDWARVPEGYKNTINIGVTSSPSPYPYYDIIRVPVVNAKTPSEFRGFPETAGMVSIEGPHFQRSSAGAVKFEKIPFLGSRSESGSLGLRPFVAARENGTATAAWAEYDFYLFSPTNALDATVYINMGLDTDPRLKMRFSLTLDSRPANFTRVLGDYIKNPTAGDIPLEWLEHVADQVWVKHVALGPVAKGPHTLRWMVNSPEVYLEKVVLNTHGGVKASYLGPPETTQV